MKNYNTKKTNSWEKFGDIKLLTKEDFEKVCVESESMAQAASKLGIHFSTFSKYAKKYGCYKPNQSGKGTKKNIRPRRNETKDYHSRIGAKRRIIKDNLISYKCEECGISEWKGKQLSLHLDHKDGNCWNHELSNLRFLCPNCHSLTETYTGKNK